MQPIDRVEGRAIPFGRKNVDTDIIIPAQWLKTISREGLGKGAFVHSFPTRRSSDHRKSVV